MAEWGRERHIPCNFLIVQTLFEGFNIFNLGWMMFVVIAIVTPIIFLPDLFRALEDWDSSPPCMADIFRCMGKAARTTLCAIARHLRLRSE